MLSARLRGRIAHFFAILPITLFVLFTPPAGRAASVRGVVTDASGSIVKGATVALLQNGKVIAEVVSGADGSYQILTGSEGRFFLLVSAKSFRQLETPGFYAGRLDSVERNMVLEPEWVRQSIVVTATGTPTPEPQTSAATTVIGPVDMDLHTTLVSGLRLMPGTAVAQLGQRGSQTGLFIRGGNSDANKVLIDGIDMGDLGNRFDFGELSTTAIERAEVFRGTNSSLYGADAEMGVVSLTSPRGTTSFPSLLLRSDGGNFNSQREEVSISGARGKLDYLGDLTWFQTSNSLPNDQYHLGTVAGNIGWQPSASTQIRGTLHANVAGVGVPNAWDFYHIADNATQKDQDLYFAGSVDNQTTDSLHNTVRYGMTRKREQYHQWAPSGELIEYDPTYHLSAYFGNPVTIKGANRYSVTGRAQLDYPQTYPYRSELVSNRDELIYQGDYRCTPHLLGLIGFKYEDERGSQRIPTYSILEKTERTNYDYIASVHGDFKTRFFYTLGGSLEHYSLFGTQTTPRAGFSWYVLRPRSGVFSGTRALFNYGDAVREPTVTDEFGSLYTFLSHNAPAATKQLHIGSLAAPFARMYEGGIQQAFLSEHILFTVRYFHNQFGKQIEYVGGALLPNLIPGLTGAQKQDLIQALGYYYTSDVGLAVNTEAYKGQGIESTVEGGIGGNLFLRGGYTYLDAKVQRSFDSDNEALAGGDAPTYNGIPIGALSPLVGARPFRRPPHAGFFTATYSRQKMTGIFNAAFTSRSDDSTFLAYSDATGGNSLLLPNRNLDHGYAKVDVGGSYALTPWLSAYGIGENLTSNQHIAPIGYPSLPFNFRTGFRLDWGLWSRR